MQIFINLSTVTPWATRFLWQGKVRVAQNSCSSKQLDQTFCKLKITLKIVLLNTEIRVTQIIEIIIRAAQGFRVDQNILKLFKNTCCSKPWSSKPCSSRTCCICKSPIYNTVFIYECDLCPWNSIIKSTYIPCLIFYFNGQLRQFYLRSFWENAPNCLQHFNPNRIIEINNTDNNIELGPLPQNRYSKKSHVRHLKKRARFWGTNLWMLFQITNIIIC